MLGPRVDLLQTWKSPPRTVGVDKGSICYPSVKSLIGCGTLGGTYRLRQVLGFQQVHHHHPGRR